MLLLIFQAARDLYAVNAVRVDEVVPKIELRRIPHAPDFLAGVFDYRGTIVPVVDLGMLLDHEPCQNQLSTRIIVVQLEPAVSPAPSEERTIPTSDLTPPAPNSPVLAERHRRFLGLIAERVSDLRSVRPELIRSASMQLPEAPYLGAIVEVDRQMVQLIDVDLILEESVRQALFGAEPPPALLGQGDRRDAGNAERHRETPG
jgi:chemotaxis-related protein WspB